MIARRLAVFALACTLLTLAGCPSRNHTFADAETLATSDAPLAWTVLGAHATHHLATSTMEARDAAPGNQFVVLDVSVRNRDLDPQVLSEGKLIAMDESNLQTFDTPVNVLNDDYLSLQVLAPDQSMRGKIAYEVPEHLPGVLYWSPGNGSKRILLNVGTAPTAQRTFADAGEDIDSDTAKDSAIDTAINSDEPIVAVTPASRSEPATTPAAPEQPKRVVADATAARPSSPSPRPASTAGVQALQPVAVPPSREIASIEKRPVEREPIQRASIERASIQSAPILNATPAIVPLPARPRIAASPPRPDPELARRQACEGLVSRDDPAEKARNLDFFAQSCREYTLPSNWQSQPVARRSLLARASELIARIVVRPHAERVPASAPACRSAASHADLLVCSDPDLAAMDRTLAQTVARARDHVDDPAALQREQQQWRGQVRDACNSVDCLQHAYGRRIARLEALTPQQR